MSVTIPRVPARASYEVTYASMQTVCVAFEVHRLQSTILDFAQNTRLHIPGAFFPILHAAGVGSTQAREMRNPAWNLLDRNGEAVPGSIDQVTRQRNSES